MQPHRAGGGAEELERRVCPSQDDVLRGLLRLEKLLMTGGSEQIETQLK